MRELLEHGRLCGTIHSSKATLLNPAAVLVTVMTLQSVKPRHVSIVPFGIPDVVNDGHP